MRETHVILRTTTPTATRDPFLGALAAPAVEELVAAGLSIEVDDIDTRDIAALARNADVLAVAQAIPMNLIAPVEVQETAQPAAATVTWGVKGVAGG